MIDLHDVSINIPIRVDSNERIENLLLVIEYLNFHFETHINICEYDKEPILNEILKDKKVKYFYYETNDLHNHKTKCLNFLCRNSTTDIIINYDADVLVPPAQIKFGCEVIRKGKMSCVYPYEGKFLNVDRKFINIIKKSGFKLDFLNEQNTQLFNVRSFGGCVIWNKKAYIESGMENEIFRSWGWEDAERIIRSKILDLEIARTEGYLFHIDHLRSTDSLHLNPYHANNQIEYEKVSNMSAAELRTYIASWNNSGI